MRVTLDPNAERNKALRDLEFHKNWLTTFAALQFILIISFFIMLFINIQGALTIFVMQSVVHLVLLNDWSNIQRLNKYLDSTEGHYVSDSRSKKD